METDKRFGGSGRGVENNSEGWGSVETRGVETGGMETGGGGRGEMGGGYNSEMEIIDGRRKTKSVLIPASLWT